MRRTLIRNVLPLTFCTVPLLAGLLIVASLPAGARKFYCDHLTSLDDLILTLGTVLFVFQLILAWRALPGEVRASTNGRTPGCRTWPRPRSGFHSWA